MDESGVGVPTVDNPIVAAIRELTAEVARLRETVALVTVTASRAAVALPAVAVSPQAPGAIAPSPTVPATHEAACDAILANMFASALVEDDDAGFEAFIATFHADRLDAPRSIPSLREFSWRSIRKNLVNYLTDPTVPGSFTIARRDPSPLRNSDRTVKVFIACKGRSPVPVTFKRDKAAGDAWRISDSSV